MMRFFTRMYYSVAMLRHHRHLLAQVNNAPKKISRVTDISPQQLHEQGINVLVLDFDGVLAAHGEHHPNQGLSLWLDECVKVFGADHIFILSNKPLPSRIAYFQQHHFGVRCIKEVRKKPYPDGLEMIMQLTGQPATCIMLVDDRLLTGVLAACIAQVQVAYISKPYVNLKKRPIQELFFIGLRVAERRLIKWFSHL
ncbi:putative hydrolase of the HAD superfamily [Beggiatoa alba B18LD]|uniref:Putative hydrolase of the HAD superfamily n=1 Tax=Beggiatoa alba B18LD TaxID=395493 RepID=I3CFP4_9GAMM|nr:putative hydrolase of the HAD superfamily [Beggiatoa alba]EIJ42437.1 putative hydrolase of the HAD superfamily [Beggiatoa alba B18LD]